MIRISPFQGAPVKYYFYIKKEIKMKAIVFLTPAESKRLIGKAVASLKQVKKALKSGMIIIIKGTTNGYIAEEILGKKLERSRFSRAVIVPEAITAIPPKEQIQDIIIDKGIVREDLKLTVAAFKNSKASDDKGQNPFAMLKKGDIIIKGANALDPNGIAGIYLHDVFGGTIGMGIGPAMARGVEIIIPVGLEKLIPTSIKDFVNEIGKGRLEHWIGMNFGIMPIMGNVVTEIESFKILFGVEAFVIGGGGVNGAEGAYHFLLKGDEKSVKKAFNLVKEIKGEPMYKPISFIPLKNFKNAEISKV